MLKSARSQYLLLAGCFVVLIIASLSVRDISSPTGGVDVTLLIQGERPVHLHHRARYKAPLTLELPPLSLRYRAQKLPDFTRYAQGEERKLAFTNFMVPLIQQVNGRQLAIRATALKLAAHDPVTKKQQRWLEQLCQLYRIELECIPSDALQLAIEKRVDAVPVALAIAQAAKESGWGTSRFAQQGNNLFGHWCFQAGCGMVPRSRLEEASHEVTIFASPQEAVAAYVLNLNSHPAYRTLRLNRQSNGHQPMEQLVRSLTLGLEDYSQRGAAYVKELQQLIRSNKGWLEFPQTVSS